MVPPSACAPPPSGDDAGPGTEARPWRTFARALAVLGPGDTLVLQDGRDARETTGLPRIDCRQGPARSGRAGRPIAMRAAHDRKARSDSDGLFDALETTGCAHWVLEGRFSALVTVTSLPDDLASGGAGLRELHDEPLPEPAHPPAAPRVRPRFTAVWTIAMPAKPSAGRPLRDRRRRTLLADVIPRLQAETALSREETLVREMVETSLRLLTSGIGLGEIKLLNAALRELRYAFKVFAPWRGVRKVSAFGSARTRPDDPAYRTAAEFARQIADHGWMMITGGGNGIMRACQEGASRERSFGVNIRLPWEQEANEFILNDPKLVTFRYFFTRKLMFIKEADAVVLFPGGFGTLDEGFEALTLAQTGKSHPMPIVFLDTPDGTYWKAWRAYIDDHLLRRGLISPEDMSLFLVTSSVEEAVAEVTGFYRVYHSSRWVGDRFVIRMNRTLAPDVVDVLGRDFAPLVVEGGMEQCGPLDEEREQEPELDTLPRLVFAARRGAFGLRRQLIDRLNHEG